MKCFSRHFLHRFASAGSGRSNRNNIPDFKGPLGSHDFIRSSETSPELYERLETFSRATVIGSGRKRNGTRASG